MPNQTEKVYLINIFLGVMFYYNGDFYDGYFKDGKRSGYGQLNNLKIQVSLKILMETHIMEIGKTMSFMEKVDF